MIELNRFVELLEENEGCLPLLTLDEFFQENEEEYSIAPNQWEFGRPPIAQMFAMLEKIQSMEGIDWVRVALHEDTEIQEEELLLSGDSIILCTTIPIGELEKQLDYKALCADGIISAKLKRYSSIPPIPENHHCVKLVWD